jgi:hypothetical protein
MSARISWIANEGAIRDERHFTLSRSRTPHSKLPTLMLRTVIESDDTKEEDVFLDLVVCQQEQQQHQHQHQPGVEVVEAARILEREQSPQDNYSNSDTNLATAVRNVVQTLVMVLLQWLWNDTREQIELRERECNTDERHGGRCIYRLDSVSTAASAATTWCGSSGGRSDIGKRTISVGLNSDSDSNEATPVAKIMFLLQRLWNDCENKVGLQMREQQGGETSSIFRENEPNNTLEFAKTTMQMYTSEQVSITLNLSNM